MRKKRGITRVIKRDKSVVLFNEKKIFDAISNAAEATNQLDRDIIKRLTDKVVSVLRRRFHSKVPNVEDIQDVVEEVLIKENHVKVVKAYVIYREKHREIRDFKAGVIKDIHNLKDVLSLGK